MSSQSSLVDRTIKAICSSLDPVAPPLTGEIELAADDAEAVMSVVQSERIVPVLTDAVNRGAVVMPSAIVERLLEITTSIMSAAVEMEARTLDVVDRLEASGLSVRVVKGLATAHLDYPNPALRQFGDVDLLVKTSEAVEAIDCLERLGLRQRRALLGNDWRLTHSIEFDAGGFEIDLHHRLLHQAAGHLADRLDLFTTPDTFTVAGRSLRALPKPIRLLHAASQNVLSEVGARKLSSDLDVLRMSDAVEPAALLASEAGLGWVLARGVDRASNYGSILRVPPNGRIGLREAIVRRAYASDERSALRMAGAEAVVAPPLWTLRSALSAFFPGREYRTRRGRSASAQLAHQLRRLGGRSS